MAADFRRLIDALVGAGVDCIVVGGVAIAAHGHVRATLDLDVCYERSLANLDRLAAALAPLHPRLRGITGDVPFTLDARTLRNGLNFTLTADAGDLDLLGELTGVGGYRSLIADAIEIDLYGHRVRVIGLDALERNKVAAGRVKDLLDVEAISAIRKRRS